MMPYLVVCQQYWRSVTIRSTHTTQHYILVNLALPAPPTTELYTLSLHDALPILTARATRLVRSPALHEFRRAVVDLACEGRSEEHTSELQSRLHLVCRLLREKKNL